MPLPDGKINDIIIITFCIDHDKVELCIRFYGIMF